MDPEQAYQHTDVLSAKLATVAQGFRLDVLDMVHRAQSGHVGGPFSAAEIVAALHLHHLNVDPSHPDWPDRDRFPISKGHAAHALYAALARCGYVPVAELATFRRAPTRLGGHPDRKLPGVEMVAGPLGTAWPPVWGWLGAAAMVHRLGNDVTLIAPPASSSAVASTPPTCSQATAWT